MYERMILVLSCAREFDVFITGLWGCGAFSHPIKEVLKTWKRALHSCRNPPKEIIFCYFLDAFTNLQDETERDPKVMDILFSG
jgi:hypothetical protein